MVTLGKTCRTVNGYDVNFMDEYKRNIDAVIDDRLDDVSDDMVSGIQKDGRGNIAPITVILPTLAMEARENVRNELRSKLTPEQLAIIDKMVEDDKKLREQYPGPMPCNTMSLSKRTELSDDYPGNFTG